MSSGSESDEEYVPGEPEQLSEEESADEEPELQYENEQQHKAKKRKANSKGKGRKKIKTRNNEKEIVEEEEEKVLEDKVDPEEEKKREDDLWAKFLEGTDTKPKPVREIKDTSTLTDTANKNSTNIVKANPKEDDKERERRIFDFAGEKIVVENNVVVDKIKSDDSSPSASQAHSARSVKKGGGISSILDQINKKNKLSTLEKSKLDWNTFKKDEGIEEEIVSHNKGKAGYLDRRDFLERSEYRQYEIERDLRMSRRSNR